MNFIVNIKGSKFESVETYNLFIYGLKKIYGFQYDVNFYTLTKFKTYNLKIKNSILFENINPIIIVVDSFL